MLKTIFLWASIVFLTYGWVAWMVDDHANYTHFMATSAIFSLLAIATPPSSPKETKE